MASALRLDVSRFTHPKISQSLFQLANTLLPACALWWAMAELSKISWALSFVLVIPAAAVRLRLALIQHDCGHGSFFRRHWANEALGAALSVFSWAPYHYWRRTHAMHHVNSSRVEGREALGSINTFTVAEYEALPKAQQRAYRLYRNPFFLVGFGGPFQFLVKHRFPWDTPRTWTAEWLAVLYTNAGLLAAGALLTHFWGLSTVLMVELPVIALTSMGAVWLIYIQHVFPTGHFARDRVAQRQRSTEGRGHCAERRPGDRAWSHEDASIHGSSFYRLPALLRWATLNVGFHHVHHYAPKIPNYRLAEAMEAHPEFAAVTPLTLVGSVESWKLKLWDEERQSFVGFTTSSSAPQPSRVPARSA